MIGGTKLNRSEIVKGYETEILYQKHMLENLGRWFSLFLGVVGIGIIMLYFFHLTNVLLLILGVVLIVVGGLGMLVIGYGIYRGNKNLRLVINEFEAKVAPSPSEKQEVAQ